ncbi:hypothetical protein ACFWVT_05415 [Streptomyces cyaneofuscatus]|uniref:hypothetical protein n=1 Tax=Streptomyces cyaneofuscatus TaxID=66883 RepID=UPI0036697AAC
MHLDAEQLALSSRTWMAAAFAAWTEGPQSEGMAVHHAGVATEHLLKAFLVRIHPSLIVDGRDFNSLLYAAGQGGLLQVRASRVKTIQLGEAYDRVHKILKNKIPQRPQGKDSWPLADARNGVAHAGYHDRAEVMEIFIDCIKVIDPLLVELGIGPDYWGLHRALHHKLRIEGVEAARVRLEQKLARARRVFAQRYGHIDEPRREIVVTTTLAITTQGYIEHAEPAACPACPSQGVLAGGLFIDVDKETVVLSPEIFQCSACDLRLESEELDMLAVPLGGDIGVNVPPEDVFDGYEADEVFDDDEPDESSPVDSLL